MRTEVSKFGGMLLALGDEHLLITPRNVVIEKLVKEQKEEAEKQPETKEEEKND